ncbi:MAG: hypothetical protein EZS28_040304 [Streblomastix strix]|uniref:Tyr recombinase domain-containing protein n=1 Tax=Streblomastix strix TaxID=222440 RepID=A0A5J4U1K1_9EUKA|nr:MAG: hypothetical protein EZS28_040304 [Streblomastix strix]
MWDIRQLFDYWRSRSDDKDLSDTEIQTKFASLLLSICFIRINETAEINLTVSNINCRNQIAALCISTKANNSIEQYEIRRTGDLKDDDKRRISLWLNSLLREIGIHGATAYSFKRATLIELAGQGLKTTKLNIFTHHSVFSRAASNYYIYMPRMQGLMISYLSSWDITAKVTLHKPSRNIEIEQLNKVI